MEKTLDIRAAFDAAKIAAATKAGWSCKGDYRITRKLTHAGYLSTRAGGGITYFLHAKDLEDFIEGRLASKIKRKTESKLKAVVNPKNTGWLPPPPKKRPEIIWPDGVKVKVIPSPKYHALLIERDCKT